MQPGPNKNVVSGFCEKEPPTLKQIIGAGSNFVDFTSSFVLTLFIFKAPNYMLARTLTERVV